jgi:uncharacterized protein (TIGR02453 family)
MMAWFEKDLIAFLMELKANNTKEWFTENKKRYEKSVKEPFNDFVAEMISRIQKDDPAYALPPKDAIFRIYRDVRFSKDKTPYKTHIAAIISPKGRKDFSSPGIYLEINSEAVNVYGGVHFVEKNVLHKIRTKLLNDPDSFNRVMDGSDFKQYFGEVLGEKNKRLPKEFAEAAQNQPLLFNKSFYFKSSMDIGVVLKDNLADEVFARYLAGKPFNLFFRELVGK